MSEPLLTPPNKSVNLVWKLGVSWVLAWKLWMSWVLNTNRLRHIALVWGHNLRLFLKFNYTSLQIFFEVIISGKCSHLIFLYIIRYDNISWRSHNPHLKIWGGHDPQTLQCGLVSKERQNEIVTYRKSDNSKTISKGQQEYVDLSWNLITTLTMLNVTLNDPRDA